MLVDADLSVFCLCLFFQFESVQIEHTFFVDQNLVVKLAQRILQFFLNEGDLLVHFELSALLLMADQGDFLLQFMNAILLFMELFLHSNG